jgi:4-hydroxythreonine-4-phosphate dehydrogenase
VRPHIAVTLGDPRGIGPEVAFEAIRRRRAASEAAEYTAIGAESAYPVAEAEGVAFESSGTHDGDDASAGRVAGRAIEQAVRGALDGTYHALVTAPIHKPSLRAAGWTVPGHTELLRDLTGTARVGMLMAAELTALGGPLRVLLATTHHALREVPGLVTEALICEQAALLDEALRSDWGIAEPRIALCALNPHGSDGGLFGDEEERILAPARERLAASGVDIAGPLPADTVFQRALKGDFDAVVAPYHDVGMAAFKTVAFGSGVNVTLGLPFIRTSPDHGTAFDIAGTGTADASSMEEALRLAERLAHARFDTESTDV